MEEIEPPHKESEALPKGRDIYRVLLAYSRDAILGVNRKGTIVFWNKGAERDFGYSSEEILGQPVTRLIPEKHRESNALALRAFLSGSRGDTRTIECEALRKDGSTFPIELSFSIEHQDGKSLGLAIARNITERKQMERALKESAEHYCNLFENCLEAVFSADIKDNSGAGNKALQKLGGYCLEELTRMKPATTISRESSEYVSGQVERILRGDEPVSSIVREIFKNDGKMLFIEQYLNSMRREGQFAGLQGSRGGATQRDEIEDQLKGSFINLARIVSHVIEFCDPYTATHQQRVAELARLVGENMGLADDVVERLYFNGLLHDIGKISIPKSILTKPGELAEEEWALIRAHTKQGYSILKDANLPWPAAEVALQHHERLDGSGYPNGVTGDKLNLEVGILAVCDVVEAMGSHRPYRPARTTTEILRELTDGRGTKYNASVVDVMLPKIESGEFESLWNCANPRNTAT